MTNRIRSQHTIRVAAPAETAFLFFTPAGEELWVEGWSPRYIDPPDGRTQAGMVFTTGDGDDFTIWQLLEFDRQALRSRYARTTPALRTGTVDIRCTAIDAGHAEVCIGYDLTALTEAGVPTLTNHAGDNYVRLIEGWSAAIAARQPGLNCQAIR